MSNSAAVTGKVRFDHSARYHWRSHANMPGGQRKIGMTVRYDEIGKRLKAFRLGAGLSADEVSRRLNISRTALYRFEKGELVKIDTLERLAELLNVSVPTLLGVGIEYVRSAVTYFERLRQIEETAQHVVILAGPISFILASDDFWQWIN